MNVIQTSSLQADAALAIKRHLPLMLIFSQHGCGFCEKLKEEVIVPMLISGDYHDKVIIRELMIDADELLPDFVGKPVAAQSIFYGYRLYVTPSVILVDGYGNEIAERQIGINTVDYYGYFLDEAIKQARTQL